MTNNQGQQVLNQLDQITPLFDELDAKKTYSDFSGPTISEVEIANFRMLCLSAIHRIAGPDSVYAEQAGEAIKHNHLNSAQTIPILYGIVKALRADVAGGYLASLRELIHASLFADFLEMSQHLLDEGYKDPAAVLIGGVLEARPKTCFALEV